MSELGSKIKRILVTGPESSGKSTFARAFAVRWTPTGENHQNQLVPEYARTYLNTYGPKYDLNDLIKIAKGQFETEDRLAKKSNAFLICDTGPLVLKIWSEVRFGNCPDFIQEAWEQRVYDQIILCPPDIPWVADPFRENPNDRDQLFTLFQEALEQANKGYVLRDSINIEDNPSYICSLKRKHE